MSALDAEEWRPVVGYEGAYSVSNLGRVLSHKRVVVRSNGWKQTIPERILKAPPNKHGYPEVHLQQVGKKETWLVHQLVLYAFVGPRPDGLVCCHGDGNPGNPRLSNLRWDTQKSNAKDAIRHGVLPRGEVCPWARLSPEQVLAIRADERPQVQIAADYEVDQSHISRIKTRDVWNHI